MSTVRIHKSPTADSKPVEQRYDRDIVSAASLVEKRTSRGDARYHKKSSPAQVAFRPVLEAVRELERRVDRLAVAVEKRRADKAEERLRALIDGSAQRIYGENEAKRRQQDSERFERKLFGRRLPRTFAERIGLDPIDDDEPEPTSVREYIFGKK